MIHSIFTAFASLLVGISGIFSPVAAPVTQAPIIVGAVNPVGGSQYTLAGAGINSTQTTMQLASFTTPDGRALTMAMFGTIGYGALEPQTTAKLEDISFTGIVQNANGSATLTGVSRGLDFVTPYAATASLAHSHAGGATFIITNTAGFYGNQFALLANDETVTGQWTFNTFPITPSSPAASETTAGIVELATGAEAAASTLSGTLGRLALPTRISTSTWNTATAGNVIPVTGVSTKVIDPKFVFPQGAASSTVLSQDASGNISWQGVSSLVNIASSSPVVFSNASSTLVSAAIPANFFGVRDSLRITLYLTETALNDTNSTLFEFAYGNATTTALMAWGSANANNSVTFVLKMGGTISSQKFAITVASSTPVVPPVSVGTGAIDTTQAKMLLVVAKDIVSGSNVWTTTFANVEVLRQ